MFTQGALAGLGRPDLQVYYEDHSGRERLLLSEHKLDAELTDYQKAGYPDWIDRDAIVLIAGDAERYRTEAPAFDAYLTWLRVAEEVDRIGVRDSGPGWRKAAVAPNAPSSLRALHELQTLLERYEIGEGGVNAVSREVVDSYARILETRARLKTFLELLRKHQQVRQLEPYWVSSYDNDIRWSFGVRVGWDVLEPIDTEYGAEVSLAPSVRWLTDDIEGPALSAGFYFAIANGRLPAVFRDNPKFAARLREAQIAAAPENRRQAKCLRLLPLRAISGHSNELSHQLDFAANWAVDAFEEIATVRP